MFLARRSSHAARRLSGNGARAVSGRRSTRRSRLKRELCTGVSTMGAGCLMPWRRRSHPLAANYKNDRTTPGNSATTLKRSNRMTNDVIVNVTIGIRTIPAATTIRWNGGTDTSAALASMPAPS